MDKLQFSFECDSKTANEEASGRIKLVDFIQYRELTEDYYQAMNTNENRRRATISEINAEKSLSDLEKGKLQLEANEQFTVEMPVPQILCEVSQSILEQKAGFRLSRTAN